MIIAVDGPSGAGKSSVCREVAKRLNFQLLDTGAIYRCVALVAIENNIESPLDLAAIASLLPIQFQPSPKGQLVFLGDREVTDEIRSFEVTQRVNLIAPLAGVRAKLLEVQRKLAKNANVIVEGRDIGSVIFPNAELKIFYTASVEARARRRMTEFIEKGENIPFDEVLKQIKERDEVEFNREVSPLVQCEEAIVLDSSELNFEEACNALQGLILEKQNALQVQ